MFTTEEIFRIFNFHKNLPFENDASLRMLKIKKEYASGEPMTLYFRNNIPDRRDLHLSRRLNILN